MTPIQTSTGDHRSAKRQTVARLLGVAASIITLSTAAIALAPKPTLASTSSACPRPSYEARYEASTRRGSVVGTACLDRIDPVTAKRSSGVAYRMVVRVADTYRNDRFCAVAQYRVTSAWVQDQALQHVAKASTGTADGCTGTTRRHSVLLEPSGVFVHPTTRDKAYGPGVIVRIDTRVCLRTTGGSGAGCSPWRTVLGR